MSKRSFRLSDSRPDARRDVDDELAFHLEMRTREFVEQGFSEEEARRKAAASFGDVGAIGSDLRSERGERNAAIERRDFWVGVRMDVKYALRALRQHRAFTAASIATLGLGIGATLAVFTVVNGVLVRPLPYKDPERIAALWLSSTDPNFASNTLPLSSGFYSDVVREQRTLESIAAFRAWQYTLAVGTGEPEPISGARVTPSLFSVLGARPLLGQPFSKENAYPGGPHVAMISYPLWQRRFGEDPQIVGKQISLNGESFTVLAVMPPGFAFPRGAELPAPFGFGVRTDVWTPLVFDSSDVRNYGTQNLSAVGRIAPGTPMSIAEADVRGILRRFLDINAPTLKLDYRLVPLAEQAGGSVKRGLLIMMGAVAFLLVIACANVASLLLARASTRQRELAVRAALGAGRSRIARQLVTENLVLAAAGTAVGMAISWWGSRIMLALVPGSMPRADDIGVDWRVVAFALAVALIAGIAFGIATAYSVSWSRLAAELHSGGTRATAGTARRLGRRLLVTAEVALALILIIGASLLTRSFIRLQQVRPGFDPSNVLTVGAAMPIAGRFDPARDGPRWAQAFEAATTQLSQIPGVRAVGAVSSLPLSGIVEGGGLRVTGRPPDPPGEGPHAQYFVVSGDYFGAARIALIAGRFFDATDDAPGVSSIIVNREFVKRYLTTEREAIDHTVVPMFTFDRGPEYRIVGVVDNVKQNSLEDVPTPQVYVRQSRMSYPGLTYVVRTDGDPLAMVATVKRVLRSVDAGMSVRDVSTFTAVLEHSLTRQRFSMALIGVFAGSALVLSLVGLYGVIVLIVGQRRREIGVRLALGARPLDVVRMVLGESARLSIAGVVLGILGAVALTRVLASMLYDVSPTDIATFAGAAVLVLAVSISAGFAPARRAARVDPTVTLRTD